MIRNQWNAPRPGIASISPTFLPAVLLAILAWLAPASAKTAFMVLPAEDGSGTTADDRSAYDTSFYTNLVDSRRYSLIDRTQTEKVLKEQALQQTGAIDPRKIAEAGRLTGADFIIRTTLRRTPAVISGTLSVLDIQSGESVFTTSIDHATTVTFQTMTYWMASRLFNRFPLVGTVTGIREGNIFTDLGAENGVRAGARLFIAREETEKDAKGKILFQNTVRVGTARVTKDSPNRSVAGGAALAPGITGVETGDLVSPDPYPEMPTVFSKTPLIPDPVPGKLLLDDNMETQKYLSPTSIRPGSGYKKDRLYLDYSGAPTLFAYALYGAPVESIDNFIAEADVRWEPKAADVSNSFCLGFRTQGPWEAINTYILFINDNGGYYVDYWKKATGFPLSGLSPTPLIRRETGDTNRLRVVARSSSFDLYINGIFLAGFTHEALEKGSLGFLVNGGASVSIDNVKVWELVEPKPVEPKPADPKPVEPKSAGTDNKAPDPAR